MKTKIISILNFQMQKFFLHNLSMTLAVLLSRYIIFRSKNEFVHSKLTNTILFTSKEF